MKNKKPPRKAANAARKSIRKPASGVQKRKKPQQRKRATTQKKAKAALSELASRVPHNVTSAATNASYSGPSSSTDLRERAIAEYRADERDPQYTLEDLVGIDQIKQAILDDVINPFAFPVKAAAVGIEAPRGLLLTGSPGTGKTALADAIVREIRRVGGKPVKYFQEGSSCLSSYLGETEQKLRSLFRIAHEEAPSVIFFDELDGMARKRSGSPHSDSFSCILTTMLSLLNASIRGRVLIIAATNCQHLVDPAMIRKGRFDLQVNIPLPDLNGRQAILRHYLEKFEYRVENNNLTLIAEATKNCSGSDLEELCKSIHKATINRIFPVGKSWTTMTPLKIRKLKAQKMGALDFNQDVLPELKQILENFNRIKTEEQDNASN